MLHMECAGTSAVSKNQKDKDKDKDTGGEKLPTENRMDEPSADVNVEITGAAQVAQQTNGEKTLKDAVKPKNKRKKKKFSGTS